MNNDKSNKERMKRMHNLSMKWTIMIQKKTINNDNKPLIMTRVRKKQLKQWIIEVWNEPWWYNKKKNN